MPNSQPLYSTAITTQGTAMDLCELLDTARSALGAAQRLMEKSANMASGGVLLVTSAKTALLAAMKDTSHASTRMDRLISLCYAVRDLEQDPNDSLAGTLHLDYNDGADDAPDPYAASSMPAVVTSQDAGDDAEDEQDTQPHATVTEEPPAGSNHHRKGEH